MNRAEFESLYTFKKLAGKNYIQNTIVFMRDDKKMLYVVSHYDPITFEVDFHEYSLTDRAMGRMYKILHYGTTVFCRLDFFLYVVLDRFEYIEADVNLALDSGFYYYGVLERLYEKSEKRMNWTEMKWLA